jgi:SAM-dependent methyltransferase
MDQEKIWDFLQTEGVASFAGTSARFRFIASQLDSRARVLNIGVGNGNLETTLFRNGIEVFSIDPSAAAIRRLQDWMGERAKVGYSQSIPFEDGMFDVVIMTEVLEHLEQEVRSATLSEVKRVLTPRGRFIGTVPADEILENNRVVCPHCGKLFHRYGHARAYSQEDLRAELSTQFQNVKIERRYFGDGSSLNWKGRVSAVIKTLMLTLKIAGSNENFYFSASNR